MSGKKIALIVTGLLVLVAIIAGTIIYSRSAVQAVTTAKAAQQDLVATVSGTGQIKPKTYVNVGATSFGRITHLYVKEGDHVKKNDTLATVENVQAGATVSAQKAAISASQTDIASYAAAEKTAEANVIQSQADLEQKTLDYNRSQQLFNDRLIAKQDFDAKKAAYDMAVATLAQRKAAVLQAKAQTESARGHMNQAVATQRANFDTLDKTISRAPFDGLVTNVPVREGETVVVGIQNSQGSTLMTLADMSVITAEVKVDESDIVNVALGQRADVTVDAFPGKVFHGTVTEVGDQALLRTTGVATSQSTTGTEEAKDFKVVVTMDANDEGLRPGLSCNAKITTARKSNVLSIPIQALVERDPVAETAYYKNHGKLSSSTGVTTTGAEKPKTEQGVFVLVRDGGTLRAKFVPVGTGILGATETEVLSGLKPGDEIVTGRYQILRTLRSGTAVKHDTAPVTVTSEDSSSS